MSFEVLMAVNVQLSGMCSLLYRYQLFGGIFWSSRFCCNVRTCLPVCM